ncbi:MAG: hypothetical protein F8N37_16365 [Telmatospirillum sp.]|nr:hypothetical protein [Telmatospirillum sp.]
MRDGISPSDVTLKYDGNDLLVNVAGSGVITVLGYANSRQLQRIDFANGTSLDLSGSLTFTGTAGDDRLLERRNGDTRPSRGEKDPPSGSDGADSHIYNIGDSQHISTEASGTDPRKRDASLNKLDIIPGLTKNNSTITDGIEKSKLTTSHIYTIINNISAIDTFYEYDDTFFVNKKEGEFAYFNKKIHDSDGFQKENRKKYISTRHEDDFQSNITQYIDDQCVNYNMHDKTFSQEKINSQTFTNTQIQNIVDAMAALTPAAAGQTTLTAALTPQQETLITANWHR